MLWNWIMVDNNAKGDIVHETSAGYESDFMRSAREAQKKLDKVSPSMCLACLLYTSPSPRDRG